MFIDSLEARIRYQHGEIKFENGIGTLNVPAGFRYLDARQSRSVLEDLWGNPPDSSVMGMIFPENRASCAFAAKTLNTKIINTKPSLETIVF